MFCERKLKVILENGPILSSWLKTHMERVEEAEKQRLIDNGLSLYPRHPENKKILSMLKTIKIPLTT